MESEVVSRSNHSSQPANEDGCDGSPKQNAVTGLLRCLVLLPCSARLRTVVGSSPIGQHQCEGTDSSPTRPESPAL